MPDYLDHGSRHRPGGSDPIPGLTAGTGNDWVFAHTTFSVGASGSANCGFTSVVYQTDDGSVFGIQSGTVSSVSMLQTGSYLVRAIATNFGTSHAGTVLVAGVIAGDVSLYDYDVHDGTIGRDATYGQAIWEQLCVVNDLATPAAAYVTFSNNTSVSLTGIASIQIFRIT